eukprot:scaffold272256_cov32-Prasinocladus_malaysianus.AAC.1
MAITMGASRRAQQKKLRNAAVCPHLIADLLQLVDDLREDPGHLAHRALGEIDRLNEFRPFDTLGMHTCKPRALLSLPYSYFPLSEPMRPENMLIF